MQWNKYSPGECQGKRDSMYTELAGRKQYTIENNEICYVSHKKLNLNNVRLCALGSFRFPVSCWTSCNQMTVWSTLKSLFFTLILNVFYSDTVVRLWISGLFCKYLRAGSALNWRQQCFTTCSMDYSWCIIPRFSSLYQKSFSPRSLFIQVLLFFLQFGETIITYFFSCQICHNYMLHQVLF